MNGKVKPGYKQTEVGVIPEDWIVESLALLSKEPMQNGVFFEPARKGWGVKLINVGDLYTHVPIDSNSLELFGATPAESERFKVEDGDLFFTRSSVVPSGIAHCNIYLGSESEAIVFDSHVIRLRPDARKVVPSYLFRHCVGTSARRFLVSHAKTGTMTTVDQGVLGRCPVVLPPTLAEQYAIAEALSDADALVEALEQLIAKKRQVKQGAMQELLTGKRRLPGFSGEWEERILGQILRLRYGKGQKGISAVAGSYPIIATSGEVGRTDTYLFDKPSVIVGRKGTIDVPQYVDTPFWAIDTTYYSEISEAVHPRFLYYLFTTIDWYAYNEASGVPSLSAKTVESIEVRMPDLSEQTAIAAVLSDMDAEIAALEARLAKARLVKQGMMQELLTGRVRLV